jgi:hypothetical protein
MGLHINLKAYLKAADDIGKRVLPRAAAGYLNSVAFEARKMVIAGMDADLDRPVTFTRRGIVVDKARPAGGSLRELESVVRVQPIQARYLIWQIDGGIKRPGSVTTGLTGDTELVTGARLQAREGGPRRYVIRQYARALRDERALRKRLAAEWSSATVGQKRRWSFKRNSGTMGYGIFRGVVGGQRGFWRRKNRGLVTLLATLERQAVYRPRLRYALYIRSAARSKMTSVAFQAELDRAMRR